MKHIAWLVTAMLVVIAGLSAAEGDKRTDPGDFLHYDAPGVKAFIHAHDGITSNQMTQDSVFCAIPAPASTIVFMVLSTECPRDMMPPAGWEATGIWTIKFTPYTPSASDTTTNHTLAFRLAKWGGTSTFACIPGAQYIWTLDWDEREIQTQCAIGS